MGIIRVLPENIANRIAAGEVVERPASIVKELVENALDAGATSIEVTIRHGGKSLIRVADDGWGMTADDAELAFQRYATSKITSADDLFRIASYGFRGEALPSIAAVARVRLSTRTADSAQGTELSIEGGVLSSAKPCSMARGTVVEVKDLFFNTPARRKFVKSDAAETGHVMDVVSNLALSRPDVRFIFKSADRTMLDLLPSAELLPRVAAIFGEDENNLFDFEAQMQGVRISGVIGKPHLARANRGGQIFFVNRRWIRSASFSYGLHAGFHGLLMHGQFPVGVIYIETDLSRVDVNVHPAKMEVRISNESEINRLIKESAAARLAKDAGLAPQLRVQTEDYRSAPARTIGAGAPVFQPALIREPEPIFQAAGGLALEEPVEFRNKLGVTKILGQIHHTFIIVETTEGMLVMDQHAAHERVMFESLVRNLRSGAPSRQKLLMDEILKFPPRQADLLEKSLPMLTAAGFEIEPFGSQTFVVRAIPSIFGSQHAEGILKAYVEEKEDGKVRTALEKQDEEVAALIACKRRAVKANDVMTPQSIRGLVEQLARCENPFSCPHGRPTFFRHTLQDLEKQFKRV